MADDFIDAEGYYGGGDKNFNVRILLFQQIGRTLANGSKEWHGGYFTNRTLFLPNGQPQEVQEYVPNSREEWQHSVESLSNLLAPYEDDEFKEERKTFEDELSKLKKEKESKEISVYLDKRADIYRILFRAISKLLKRKNYLEFTSLEN